MIDRCTFKTELNVDRQFNPLLNVGLEDVNPAQKRAFVIARPTADETTCPLVNGEGERICVPAIGDQGLLRECAVRAQCVDKPSEEGSVARSTRTRQRLTG